MYLVFIISLILVSTKTLISVDVLFLVCHFKVANLNTTSKLYLVQQIQSICNASYDCNCIYNVSKLGPTRWRWQCKSLRRCYWSSCRLKHCLQLLETKDIDHLTLYYGKEQSSLKVLYAFTI